MTFIALYSLNVSLVLFPASLDHFALLQGMEPRVSRGMEPRVSQGMEPRVNRLFMPRRERVCGFYLMALSIRHI